MIIDVDQIVDAAMGWTLQLRLGGQLYNTRPPVVADLLQIAAAAQAKEIEPLFDAVKSMLVLEAGQPLPAELSAPHLLAVASVIMHTAQVHASKKVPAIVVSARAAVEKAMGESHGSSTLS